MQDITEPAASVADDQREGDCRLHPHSGKEACALAPSRPGPRIAASVRKSNIPSVRFLREVKRVLSVAAVTTSQHEKSEKKKRNGKKDNLAKMK